LSLTCAISCSTDEWWTGKVAHLRATYKRGRMRPLCICRDRKARARCRNRVRWTTARPDGIPPAAGSARGNPSPLTVAAIGPASRAWQRRISPEIRRAYYHGYRALVTLDCDFTRSSRKISPRSSQSAASDAFDKSCRSRYKPAAHSPSRLNLYRQVLTPPWGNLLTAKLLPLPYDANPAGSLVLRLEQSLPRAARPGEVAAATRLLRELHILHRNGCPLGEIPTAGPISPTPLEDGVLRHLQSLWLPRSPSSSSCSGRRRSRIRRAATSSPRNPNQRDESRMASTPHAHRNRLDLALRRAQSLRRFR